MVSVLVGPRPCGAVVVVHEDDVPRIGPGGTAVPPRLPAAIPPVEGRHPTALVQAVTGPPVRV